MFLPTRYQFLAFNADVIQLIRKLVVSNLSEFDF